MALSQGDRQGRPYNDTTSLSKVYVCHSASDPDVRYNPSPVQFDMLFCPMLESRLVSFCASCVFFYACKVHLARRLVNQASNALAYLQVVGLKNNYFGRKLADGNEKSQ